MNPHWLARAVLFESRPVLERCSRGHDVLAEGIYFTTQTVKGKRYRTKLCRRCRIEDVQRHTAKKKQANALALREVG